MIHIRKCEGITSLPEIRWHDAMYHDVCHYLNWPCSENIRIFWFRPAEGVLVLWTFCLLFYRTQNNNEQRNVALKMHYRCVVWEYWWVLYNHPTPRFWTIAVSRLLIWFAYVWKRLFLFNKLTDQYVCESIYMCISIVLSVFNAGHKHISACIPSDFQPHSMLRHNECKIVLQFTWWKPCSSFLWVSHCTSRSCKEMELLIQLVASVCMISLER